MTGHTSYVHDSYDACEKEDYGFCRKIQVGSNKVLGHYVFLCGAVKYFVLIDCD